MGAGGTALVGRDSERELVASLLRRAADGNPGALLISGEPGIGKTSLVTEVTASAAATGRIVLWGHCLRFGAESSPYLPVGQLLTQWHRQAEPAERRRVLTGAEHLATIAPTLGTATGPAETARVLPLVAEVLDRVADHAPPVLVIDDIQWADGSSLDLLAYLLAGFAPGQRLCVLATYRDTELGQGHRLHGWLADVLRLPSVSGLRLERLGYADAEELVARLDRAATVRTDAAEVFARSEGNPYYTELLVRASARGPGSDPGGLSPALLSSWHRLEPEARELLQLLAVGGRPVAVGVLEGLAAGHGRTPEQVAGSLAEAAAAGLTTTTRDGDVWFHHPLLAEVIATTLTPTARQLVHQQYVDVIESSTNLTTTSQAAHLALHHAGSGDVDQAFVWSLRAADGAAALRGYAEEFEHLHRACRLWPDVEEAALADAGQRVDLWQRASDVAWGAGEHLIAIRLREEAIGFTDPAVDPVRAVQLRLPQPMRRQFCGLEAWLSKDATRATLVVAEAHCPGSPEHVQALARLAHAELWEDDYSAATAHAAAAVRVGRNVGSAEALAWALSVRSQLPELGSSLADATQALTLAREVGDPELLGWATVTYANRLHTLGRDQEAAAALLTTFLQLTDAGSLLAGSFIAGAWAALLLLEHGQWHEAREVLRLHLSHRLPAGAAAPVRGVAALLALRTGDAAAGRTHLARFHELHPQRTRPGDGMGSVLAEAHWALGEPRSALELAARAVAAFADLDPHGGDEILVIAARAAADLAEQAGRAEAAALLDRVEQQRGTRPQPFRLMGDDDLIHPARECLYVADRARCLGEPEQPARWRAAVSACAAADMVWHESLASYQLARALLAEHGPRTETAAALRHAAGLARSLGAEPLLHDVQHLARQAHITLEEPRPAPDVAGAVPALTPREREVLAELVTGRTYAEIATDLFISEKTVSVHVSHLLRKTGTTSRVELAELARRTG